MMNRTRFSYVEMRIDSKDTDIDVLADCCIVVSAIMTDIFL